MEVCTAAANRSDSWRQCCLKALGLEDWILLEQSDEEEDKDDDPQQETQFEVINLLPATGQQQQQQPTVLTNLNAANVVDPWMATALQIQSNLRDMSDWMEQKRHDYVSIEMSDEEATLIQSTVTSFTATTASEIEALHSCLQQQSHQQPQQHQQPQPQQYQQHCSGIVQILMAQLQQEIAEPWKRLQKARQRTAVQLWQTPLQCRLWTPSLKKSNQNESSNSNSITKRETLELLGLDDDDDEDDHHLSRVSDQRFYPTRPSHALHRNFLATYDPPVTTVVRQPQKPGFVIHLEDWAVSEAPSSLRSAVPPQHPAPHNKRSTMVILEEEAEDPNNSAAAAAAAAAALEQESTLLQAMVVHSDLDSVQRLEQTMVDITGLLSQFASLVAEQQENVWDIADSATTTKDNIERGQEHLLQATEATAAGSYLLAKGIVAMACLLLLLNWLVA